MSKIFVAGLDYNTSEKTLNEAFGKYGTLVSTIIIKDRDSGKSRGFGFVEFDNPQSSRLAIDGMDQEYLDGRKITVDVAKEKPKSERRNDKTQGKGRDKPYNRREGKGHSTNR